MVEVEMTRKQLKQWWRRIRVGIANDLRNELVRACPVDTGRLKGSIKYRVKGNVIEIYMVGYALYVEFGCFFDENTKILTKDGWQSLKNILVGSFVWNGSGYSKVIQKEKIEIGYEIKKVIITAGDHTLELTEDHPVMTKSGWKKATNITEEDEVFVHESST